MGGSLGGRFCLSCRWLIGRERPAIEAGLERVGVEPETDGGRIYRILPRLPFPGLDKIGQRAGFPKRYIKLHMLRHTYTAARIQTCDRGRPVALYTVARELGWTGTDMLEDRYGHLHDRTEAGGTEVVEFRVEHHREALKGRLEVLK